VRLLADSNIVAQAVRSMRRAGYDVVYAAERAADPGDEALLAEAATQGRVFLTQDHDIGTLVHRDSHAHCGIILLADLGDALAETNLILAALESRRDQLDRSAFLRVSPAGVRESRGDAD
jgi:predicted nuclease of predicted toxin-antitoxin system